jgi:2-polyprenyl-3-methyl-5-hydroxy-6-metoxy-1,4-benzoquinol methylase
MPINCSLCQVEANFLFDAKDINRKISNESFSYHRCPKCQLVFLPQIPENLGDYYDGYYQFPTLGEVAQTAHGERFKIEMVQKFAASGKLLEIGPSVGIFCYQAKQAGFEVDAIEMSPDCCEFLSKEIGINAVNSNNPPEAIKKMGTHDVIVLWHNIEHLPDPWACLDQVSQNLTPGGILLIATPNPNSLGFRILGSQWPHVDAPRHLNLIPLKTLIEFLKPRKLKPIMTTANDPGAQYWNRFSWQVYLMNRFNKSGKIYSQVSRKEWLFWAALGYIISLPLALLERNNLHGSAYTVIFRKEPLTA